LLKDAQRKERMGDSRGAQAALAEARKFQQDANRAEGDKLRYGADIAARTVQYSRPAKATGSGDDKPLKMNEMLYADNVNFLKQTEKPKEGETPAQFEARIRAQAGAMTIKQAKTSDIGDTKANIMREGQLLNEDINVQKAMKSFLNNPKYLAADAAGNGDEVFDAELKRQRAGFHKGRVTPPTANPAAAPASSSAGGGQRDYSNLWNQNPK